MSPLPAVEITSISQLFLQFVLLYFRTTWKIKKAAWAAVTDAVNAVGVAAWGAVTDAVNAVGVAKRSDAEVCRKWTHLSSEAKRKLAGERKERRQTGIISFRLCFTL